MEWHDIKDGLPPGGSILIVTVFEHCRNKRELRYPVYYLRKPYSLEYGFYLDGCDLLIPEVSEVLAWMPIPDVWDGEID